MRIAMTADDAEALARRLYAGASQPLTGRQDRQRPLDVEWWRHPRKVERFTSTRHEGALSLYCEIGRHAAIPLPENAFPSRFDFDRGKALLPDKGFIKMCLNADPAILIPTLIDGHLIFELTDAGRTFLPVDAAHQPRNAS